ncbi:MAG: hypothetical protein KatS3mg051_1226 [Anaerolineae bacterium]|nr:MAG: hypothetical protein KatS3mg051_1226 [Anaerolineae bacterium]
MTAPWNDMWKANWETVRQRFIAWWQHEGLVLHVLAPRDNAPGSIEHEQAPFFYLISGLDTLADYPDQAALQRAWLDPVERARRAEQYLQGIYFGGEAFPFYDTHLGPGNLATFLGAEPEFARDTVWYHPCIDDLETHPPLRFDPQNPWFLRQKAILEEGVRLSQGRFHVAIPDLVENLDILSALRDPQRLLLDLIERPELVQERIAQINQVYFEVFEQFFAIVRDPWGGNVFSAFCIWGPGKTAKVQCDAAAMISPRMFRRFVVPALAEQCAWLDYSLYHLDGTQAIVHLDALLEIEALDAIEWTPQVSLPQGGAPMWYDLYRRILAAGKSVQAIDVRPQEVIPLLDAVGPRGMFIMVNADSQAEAEALIEAVEAYR